MFTAKTMSGWTNCRYCRSPTVIMYIVPSVRLVPYNKVRCSFASMGGTNFSICYVGAIKEIRDVLGLSQ